MTSKPDEFLLHMKKRTDALIQDDALQKLLSWTRDKAASVNTPYKLAAIRSYYINLAIYLKLEFNPITDFQLTTIPAHASGFTHAIDPQFDADLHAAKSQIYNDITLDRDLYYNLEIALFSYTSYDLEAVGPPNLELDYAYEYAKKRKLNTLARHLKKLSSQTHSLYSNIRYGSICSGHEEDFPVWGGRLRELMVRERNIGHRFNLSKEQVSCLENYLYANKLIVDCLNCQTYVSKSVREEILNTLLIPPGL